VLEYQETLIPGRLIKRYKRFFADIETDAGVVTAHCANTGRMTGLLCEGAPVWIRRQPPGRKLHYAWELVETSWGMACVNTIRANELVALSDLSIWINHASLVRREPRIGLHRFDLELSRKGQPAYVEIKSVTLYTEGGRGLFPDAPSARATQHVRILTEMARTGIETHLLWVAMHTGIRSVAPHWDLDGDFAAACRGARAAGVQIRAVGANITPQGISLNGVIACSVD
jgi:sugar fermentation stimulation protein A